jgi:branched-chain amino acid aminotransferase
MTYMAGTFEVIAGGLDRPFESATLAEATRALPTGAYTTLRTYGGDRVWRLDHHRRRLEQSVELQGRPAALDIGTLRRALAGALRATGYPESRLRVTFAPPRLFVSVEPFAALPDHVYEAGVGCVTVEARRDNPHAKDTRFVVTAQDAYQALPPDAHEGLLVGADGVLLEGLSSNFFAIRDGALWTEEERVLPGLTRALVLELAAPRLPRGPRGPRREELPSAQEAFLTSASRGVLPVVRVDGVVVGGGRPGALTHELRARFDERVWQEAETVG